MTPAQIDAATNGALWAYDQAAVYGPGLAVAAAGVTASWTCSRISRWRYTRRGIRRLQQYAGHPGSRAVLDDFHQPRKEERP